MLGIARISDAMQHELDEIVADLPPASVIHGPSSISQHPPTCKIHCSNPEDMSRSLSFKHFQDYAMGVTKDGLYFVADKLERMFPENATRTKVLLGSLSAIQLLKDNGAATINHSLEGKVLHFRLEAMPGGFQDPFFTCDPPLPMPAPPPLTSLWPASFGSLSSSNGLAPNSFGPAASSSGPFPSSFGSAPGLLVGANMKGGFWHSLANGSLNVWQTLASHGVRPFCNGLVIGFVDEILGTIVPARYKNQLNYIKNLLKGASVLIGTSVLIYMIVNRKAALTPAITSVLTSYVFNLVGGTVGAALGKLLQLVKNNFFTNENTPLPTHVDLQSNNQHAAATSGAPVPAEAVHYCGQEDNGFMHIGLCINCNVQPAVFGFVHSKDDVAHSAFCLSCSPLYRRSTCVCCAEVSSTFYFSPTAPTCCAWTCIAVAPCVTCDEDGVALPKTASVWRLRRSEETQVTHRTVTLDVRYCRDHFPVDPHSDVFRYGRFFATGYM